LSELCVGKQFFHIISAMEHISDNCFPNALWASASGGFRIVSDILVIRRFLFNT